MDDVLSTAPDASYEAQATRPYLSPRERARASGMIGRPLRGRSTAAVRCRWGLPAVLRVDPALRDGTPFPTVFWLACPIAASAVGRLEGAREMVGRNEALAADPQLADAYREAARRYVAFRNTLGPRVPGDPAAGGMPDRVKCLHALYGHHLATDDNPVGAWVAEQIEPLDCPQPCAALPPPSTAGK